MGRMPKHRPSFFKVLIGDYIQRLRIPPAFVKNFKRQMLSKKFILKTDNGKLWIVNMKRIGEDYFFRKGWSKFVKDCHLEFGEFLLFWLDGDSTFEVVTYGLTGCPKNLNSAVKRRNNDLAIQSRGNPRMDGHKKPRFSGSNSKRAKSLPVKKETRSEGGVLEAAGSAKPEHPHFVAIMKKYNRYAMFVPRSFAAETGMAWKRNAVLRDPEGKAWEVKICASSSVSRNIRVDMVKGWSDFRKANKLADGDACLFQFIRGRGDVIHLHVLIRRRKGRSGARQLSHGDFLNPWK